MNRTQLDLDLVLGIVRSIAHAAGDLLREAYQQPRQIDYKGAVNLVTQADRAAEAAIVMKLQEEFPGYAILAEESGKVAGSNLVWVVDPLDGTNNFAHGFPVFCVSIALLDREEPIVGVTYDPLRDECFSAIRGGGAFLNRKEMHVSGVPDLHHGLLATGFPYDRLTAADNNSKAFAMFLRHAQGIRRAGSAALDLAYVACGRLDGFWEMRLHPWDVAAGVLLVREAGGMVTSYSGHDDNEPILNGDNIVATNGLIHDDMVQVLQTVYKSET